MQDYAIILDGLQVWRFQRGFKIHSFEVKLLRRKLLRKIGFSSDWRSRQ